MNKLCIIGAGGHGKVVADLANQLNRWQIITFLDNFQSPGTLVAGFLVEGTIDCLPTLANEETVDVIVALGDNNKRMAVVRQCGQWQLPLVTLVHPQAYVSETAKLGPGCVVLAQAAINTQASLAAACIVNTGAVIEHECSLADGCHVSPNASLAGQVRLGKQTWVGMNACVKERVRVGDHVKIGAGSVVLHDLPNHVTAVGAPAQVIDSITS